MRQRQFSINSSKRRLLSASIFALLIATACGVPQDEFDAMQAERDAAVANGARLEQEKSSLESDLSSVEAERDAADEAIATLEAVRDEANTEIESLTTERDGLGEELSELEAAHAEVMERVNELESLEAREAELQTSISELTSQLDEIREQRTPLIPDVYEAGFLCTGSMNPRITCMDRGVWLDNFNPSDIVAGAVIAFDSSGLDCKISSESVAHRVIDIRMESGDYLFLTKGDNNSGDDGCWIPESQVHSYMTELIERDYSEMQEVLDEVWLLEAQEKSLRADIERMDAEYNTGKAEYDQYLQDHCSWNGSQWMCMDPWYAGAMSRLSQLQSLVSTLDSTLDQYYAVCNQVRDLRIGLQELRDIHYGESNYVFDPCS